MSKNSPQILPKNQKFKKSTEIWTKKSLEIMTNNQNLKKIFQKF